MGYARHMFKTDLKGQRKTLGDKKSSFIIASILLFITHVLVLICIPLLGLREARCLSGFDWRNHSAYVVYQFVARMTELYFYWTMGGIGIGFGWLGFKLSMGILGGLDFYTDLLFIFITKM